MRTLTSFIVHKVIAICNVKNVNENTLSFQCDSVALMEHINRRSRSICHLFLIATLFGNRLDTLRQ